MGTIKIKLNTWNRKGNRDTRYKRNIAYREGYVDICPNTNTLFIKEGAKKWKPYDTAISRHKDRSYIEERKKLYSGLCFETRKDAKNFMLEHKSELDSLASKNPIFDHWSIMNVIGKFEPKNKKVYGKDIK